MLFASLPLFKHIDDGTNAAGVAVIAVRCLLSAFRHQQFVMLLASSGVISFLFLALLLVSFISSCVLYASYMSINEFCMLFVRTKMFVL